MRKLGYKDVCLGKDLTAAKIQAVKLNDEWDRFRRGESKQTKIKIYPAGSLGAGYIRVLAIREQDRKDKGRVWTSEHKSRDDWLRAWRWLGPIFGDMEPKAILPEQLQELRTHILEEVGEREAHRVIKVFRALWKKLPVLHFDVGLTADPSKLFSNPEPNARKIEWPYEDVLVIVQRAWDEGYYGLAAAIATAWDSMFSPIDVRKLTRKQRRTDERGQTFFETARTKTGEDAIATLTSWSQALLDGYLVKMAERGIELLGNTPLFWSCGYTPGAKGGRPWPPRPYTKDRLCEDFRRIRTLVFGPHDPRQLQDMRRSGAGEANLGGVNPSHLSAQMANTISESNRLQKAYLPKKLAIVRKVDEARLRGREKNKVAKKVTAPPAKR